MKKLLIPAAVVAAFVLVLVGAWKFGMIESLLGGGTGSYKAVALTNGMSYFGKVKNQNDNFITLTDVFYLRVKASNDPKVATLPASQRDLELIKLGNEIYGPQDEITLNRRAILSIEGLKADSKVLRAIGDYYKTRGTSKEVTPDPKKGKVNVGAD